MNYSHFEKSVGKRFALHPTPLVKVKPGVLGPIGPNEWLLERVDQKARTASLSLIGKSYGKTLGYYSVQVGSWRVIALNSMIEAGAGSEQERWLRTELTTHPAHCTLAFWHHPLISSGLMGNNPKMRDIFQALHEGGVDVVINGHDHVYERFAPQDA
jgi:3',5'-cyclic AMP phosphodiesterase CpdA